MTTPGHSPNSSGTTTNKAALRRQIRRVRRQLSTQQQTQAALELATRVTARINRHHHQTASIKDVTVKVALFLSMDGEIDTQVCIEQLWQQQIEVYIPLIHPFNRQQLVFIRYQQHTELIRSPLGMLEPKPDCSKLCPLAQLDLLFIPLVAFDAQGRRLGMGGGFYDRTLHGHYQQRRSKPQIIGLAHDCQRVDSVPVDPWDLPLAEIITPSSTYPR